MNRFEQKRMSLFQRATFALLLLVCILLVVVLLPVNEGETASIFVRRSKASFGRRYNNTYPLTKPTSELGLKLRGCLLANHFLGQDVGLTVGGSRAKPVLVCAVVKEREGRGGEGREERARKLKERRFRPHHGSIVYDHG